MLARGAANTLQVLSVYAYEPPSPKGTPPVSMTKGWESWKRETDAFMSRKVEDYRASLQHEDLHLSVTLRVGNPRDLIARVARNPKADLLVMGAHSKRSALDMTLGGAVMF
jgi:nucleotide-binding universal stress UspA family protein